MKKYICKNCNWNTDHLGSMERHLLLKNKNKCSNINKKDFALYNIDERFVFSIIPHEEIEKYKVDQNKNIKNIHLHINELIEKIKFIYLHKIKNCPYCNINCKNYQKLKNHVILKCFMDSKNKNNSENNININENNITSSILTINNNNSNNNSNNTNITIENINIEIKYPVSFTEQDWNLEKIDEKRQQIISIHKFAYSSLLKEILKNNINNNVYIDKNNMTTHGLVFINNDTKFIPMSIDNIMDRSMHQLNKLLIYINKKFQLDCEKEYDLNINDIIRKKNNINKKYNSFLESKQTKEDVKILFTEIFNDYNDVSKKLYDEFMMIINNNDNIDSIDDDTNGIKEIKVGF